MKDLSGWSRFWLGVVVVAGTVMTGYYSMDARVIVLEVKISHLKEIAVELKEYNRRLAVIEGKLSIK